MLQQFDIHKKRRDEISTIYFDADVYKTKKAAYATKNMLYSEMHAPDHELYEFLTALILDNIYKHLKGIDDSPLVQYFAKYKQKVDESILETYNIIDTNVANFLNIKGISSQEAIDSIKNDAQRANLLNKIGLSSEDALKMAFQRDETIYETIIWPVVAEYEKNNPSPEKIKELSEKFKDMNIYLKLSEDPNVDELNRKLYKEKAAEEWNKFGPKN